MMVFFLDVVVVFTTFSASSLLPRETNDFNGEDFDCDATEDEDDEEDTAGVAAAVAKSPTNNDDDAPSKTPKQQPPAVAKDRRRPRRERVGFFMS